MTEAPLDLGYDRANMRPNLHSTRFAPQQQFCSTSLVSQKMVKTTRGRISRYSLPTSSFSATAVPRPSCSTKWN